MIIELPYPDMALMPIYMRFQMLRLIIGSLTLKLMQAN
jgi:hypothetical protein